MSATFQRMSHMRFDSMAVNARLNVTYSETALPTITIESVRASDARALLFLLPSSSSNHFFFHLFPPLSQHRHSGLEQSAGCPRCTPLVVRCSRSKWKGKRWKTSKRRRDARSMPPSYKHANIQTCAAFASLLSETDAAVRTSSHCFFLLFFSECSC